MKLEILLCQKLPSLCTNIIHSILRRSSNSPSATSPVSPVASVPSASNNNSSDEEMKQRPESIHTSSDDKPNGSPLVLTHSVSSMITTTSQSPHKTIMSSHGPQNVIKSAKSPTSAMSVSQSWKELDTPTQGATDGNEMSFSSESRTIHGLKSSPVVLPESSCSESPMDVDLPPRSQVLSTLPIQADVRIPIGVANNDNNADPSEAQTNMNPPVATRLLNSDQTTSAPPIPLVVDGFKVPQSMPPKTTRTNKKKLRRLSADEFRKVLEKGGKVVAVKDLNRSQKNSKVKSIVHSDVDTSKYCKIAPAVNNAIYGISPSTSTPGATEIATVTSGPLSTSGGAISSSTSTVVNSGCNKYLQPSSKTLIAGKDTQLECNYDSSKVIKTERTVSPVTSQTLGVTSHIKTSHAKIINDNQTRIAADALLELNRIGSQRIHSNNNNLVEPQSKILQAGQTFVLAPALNHSAYSIGNVVPGNFTLPVPFIGLQALGATNLTAVEMTGQLHSASANKLQVESNASVSRPIGVVTTDKLQLESKKSSSQPSGATTTKLEDNKTESGASVNATKNAVLPSDVASNSKPVVYTETNHFNHKKFSKKSRRNDVLQSSSLSTTQSHLSQVSS